MAITKAWMQSFVFLSVCMLPPYVEAANPGKRINSFAGPYTIVVHKQLHDGVRNTSLDKMWARFYTTPRVAGQPQYVWGTSFNGLPLDDTLDVDIRVSKWSNNQWKENAFVFKFPRACSTILAHTRGLTRLFMGEEAKRCPIKEVTHIRTLPNNTLNVIFPSFPIFHYGRWLFTIFVLKKKDILGSIALDGEAIPKI